MVGDHQNLNGSCDLTTPLSGIIVIRGLGLSTVNQSTKFKVSNSTHYEDMTDDTKYQKWGGLGSTGSLEIAPFHILNKSYLRNKTTNINGKNWPVYNQV